MYTALYEYNKYKVNSNDDIYKKKKNNNAYSVFEVFNLW